MVIPVVTSTSPFSPHAPLNPQVSHVVYPNNRISFPHLLREAVVHRNRKWIKRLMEARPEIIAETDSMLMNSSYAKIHAYWNECKAVQQNKMLLKEIGTVAQAPQQKRKM